MAGGDGGGLSRLVVKVAVGGGRSSWLVAEVAASRGRWLQVADFGRSCRCCSCARYVEYVLTVISGTGRGGNAGGLITRDRLGVRKGENEKERLNA